MTQEIVYDVKLSNREIIIQALKELGSATNDELRSYFYRPENLIRFQRRGQPWNARTVEHDTHYCAKNGFIVAVMVDRRTHKNRFYLAESLGALQVV